MIIVLYYWLIEILVSLPQSLAMVDLLFESAMTQATIIEILLISNIGICIKTI